MTRPSRYHRVHDHDKNILVAFVVVFVVVMVVVVVVIMLTAGIMTAIDTATTKRCSNSSLAARSQRHDRRDSSGPDHEPQRFFPRLVSRVHRLGLQGRFLCRVEVLEECSYTRFFVTSEF